jgi:hypothetical protein
MRPPPRCLEPWSPAHTEFKRPLFFVIGFYSPSGTHSPVVRASKVTRVHFTSLHIRLSSIMSVTCRINGLNGLIRRNLVGRFRNYSLCARTFPSFVEKEKGHCQMTTCTEAARDNQIHDSSETYPKGEQEFNEPCSFITHGNCLIPAGSYDRLHHRIVNR